MLQFILATVFLLFMCILAYNLCIATQLTLIKTHTGCRVIIKRKLLGIMTIKTEVFDEITHFDYKALKTEDSITYEFIMHNQSGATILSDISLQSDNQRRLKKINSFLQKNHLMNTRKKFRIDYDTLVFRTLFVTPFFMITLLFFLYSLFSAIVSDEKKSRLLNFFSDTIVLNTDLVEQSTAPEYFPKDAFWVSFCDMSIEQQQQYSEGMQENQSVGKSYLSLKRIKKELQQASQGDWYLLDILEQDDALVAFYQKGAQKLTYTFVQNERDVDCHISLKEPAVE